MQVDWFRVIVELEQAEVSMRAMSVEADVALGTIAYWKNGGEPKFRNGQMLINLYMRRTGREPPLKQSSGSSGYTSPVIMPQPPFQATLAST